jgi:CRP-like cAMP-binding protein
VLDANLLRTNHLLGSLPSADRTRILPELEAVTFKLGDVLYESGVALRHLYFPTTSVVSLLFVTESGASTELAVAGREGVVGIGLFMGGESTPSRAVVQIAGDALRLPVAALDREFKRGGPLQLGLLRFTQALITQMSQTAVCNRHHSVEQQLCRWLLLSLDRVDAHELRMTQQLIADMLGVRREGVTEAAGKLQEWGCIRYSRGLIKVVDREGLERRVCECYSVVNREYGRLLNEAVHPR